MPRLQTAHVNVYEAKFLQVIWELLKEQDLELVQSLNSHLVVLQDETLNLLEVLQTLHQWRQLGVFQPILGQTDLHETRRKVLEGGGQRFADALVEWVVVKKQFFGINFL